MAVPSDAARMARTSAVPPLVLHVALERNELISALAASTAVAVAEAVSSSEAAAGCRATAHLGREPEMVQPVTMPPAPPKKMSGRPEASAAEGRGE
eukprot:scaffold266794_cov28-Tisochrysis_lutea.AAC.1